MAEFKRAKREQTKEPVEITVGDEVLRFKPDLGFGALECISRAESTKDEMAIVAAMFDFLKGQSLTDDDWQALRDLDLSVTPDDDGNVELMDFAQMLMEQYGEPGKSSASPKSSSSGGAHLKPTSNGSTGWTLPPSGSVAESESVG